MTLTFRTQAGVRMRRRDHRPLPQVEARPVEGKIGKCSLFLVEDMTLADWTAKRLAAQYCDSKEVDGQRGSTSYCSEWRGRPYGYHWRAF